MKVPFGTVRLNTSVGLDTFSSSRMRFVEDTTSVTLASVEPNIALAQGLGLVNASAILASAQFNPDPARPDAFLVLFPELAVTRAVPAQRSLPTLVLRVQVILSARAKPGDRVVVETSASYERNTGEHNATEVAYNTLNVVGPTLELRTFIDPFLGVFQSGDSLNVEVVVSHLANSTAGAYDVRLTDLGSIHWRVEEDTIACRSGCSTAGVRLLPLATEAFEQAFSIPHLPLGARFSRSWNITLLQSVPAGRRLKDEFLVEYDSHPGTQGVTSAAESLAGAPATPLQDSQSMDIRPLAISSRFNSTTLVGAVPPSELTVVADAVVTFLYQVDMPRATADTEVRIFAPPIFTALASRVVALDPLVNQSALRVGDAGQLSGGGAQVRFDFGGALQGLESNTSSLPLALVVAVDFRVDARLMEPYALRNQEVRSDAFVLFNGNDVLTRTTSIVREPRLIFSDAVRFPDAADEVVFALFFEHDGSESENAFDFHATYVLDPRLVQRNESLYACVYTGIRLPSPIGNSSCSSRGGIRVDATVFSGGFHLAAAAVPQGSRLHASISATVVQEVTPRDVLSNGVAFLYDSSPHPAPFSGLQYNDSATVITIIRNPVVDYRHVLSSDAFTVGSDITLEENVTTDVLVVLPEGVYADLRVVITTPIDMDFFAARPLQIGGSITGSSIVPGGAPNGSLFNVSHTADGTRTVITARYGDLLNTANNTFAEDDTLTVRPQGGWGWKGCPGSSQGAAAV